MRLGGGVLVLALGWTVLLGASPEKSPHETPNGRSIMERSNQALYYAGGTMRASMDMQLGSGQEVLRRRVMTVLRWTSEPGGDQKYLLYFHKPGDVRRMSCMVWKHVGAPDERWMYMPMTAAVQKVQAPDRSSFLGSEFKREEFSGRDVDADVHRFLRIEALGGRECYVVESVPRKVDDFTRAVSWIDREHYLPWKEEFYDVRGRVARVLRVDRVTSIPAPRGRPVPTAVDRTMTHIPSGRWTRVVLDSVQYGVALREEDFSDRHMRIELSRWLP